MINWELKEKYDTQDVKFTELRAKHEASVKEAEEKLAVAVAHKQEILRREFEESADLSAERAKSVTAVEKAEKALQEAKELSDAARTYIYEKSKEGRIKAIDLALDWNGNVVKEIREKELAPIVDRLTAAKSELYNALLDFYELTDKYEPLRKDVAELEDRESDAERRTKQHVVPIEQEYNLPFVSDLDVRNIKRERKLPEGFIRKPIQSK
ncbi:hypothetical protein YSY43_15720 [Paenibacillus sp. YSY-4.3]